MRNKPNWNSSRTSILDILVSQKRLHKPKTSTSMLWIGGGKGGVSSTSSSNYAIAMIQHIITSFIILIYILHPCAASLKSHNSEVSSQFSTITHQSNVSSDSQQHYHISFDENIIDTDKASSSKHHKDDSVHATACLTRVSAVVEANFPELLVLPNEEELSAFTTSRLHINVAWSHIDALLNANGDKWCVGSYLVEYGPYKYERHKRESESSSADVSPSLGRDKTEYTLILDDNCVVYSVHLVVIPAVVVKKPSDLDDLITSGRRKFWPAAYRTVLDVYSDSAVVSWPPACSYMTKEWSLEACPIVTSNNYDLTDSKKGSSGIPSKPEYSCVHMDLSAESTVHMPKLLPCKFYQFRLKAVDDLLWTFAPSRTLPTPQVDSKSFTTSIHLTINQKGDCDERALVHHWRVRYCEHEDDEHDNEISLDIENDVRNENLVSSNERHLLDIEGSGSLATDDEDNKGNREEGEIEYYEDAPLGTHHGAIETIKEKTHTRRPSSSPCQNILYDISSSHGKIKIDHLKECTLYTVDVSPVDASGHTIRPSEQFGSVHSTLCPGNKEDSDSGSFWFGDESTSSEKKINGGDQQAEDGNERNTQLVRFSKDSPDNNTMHLSILSLTILVLISVVLFLGLTFLVICKIKRGHYIFKTNALCNHQPLTIVSSSSYPSSSSSKFHRILSRVGKSLNENHKTTCDDYQLPSVTTSKNNSGYKKHIKVQPPNNNKKCQKVLIATSGKNGIVENKSICSTKINNSKSINSLTPSNYTITEDDEEEDIFSPKSVLLNPN